MIMAIIILLMFLCKPLHSNKLIHLIYSPHYLTYTLTQTLPSHLYIKPLSLLLQERSQHNIIQMFQHRHYHAIFQFGVNPKSFRLSLLIYFKHGYWQNSQPIFQRIKAFIHTCNAHTQLLALEKQKLVEEGQRMNLVEEGQERWSEMGQLILQYRHYLSIQILPGFIYEYEFCNLYIEQLILYLQSMKRLKRALSNADIYCILKNLQKILFKNSNQYFNNEKDNAWAISHAFNLFLQSYLSRVNELPTNYKSTVVLIAKTLRANNLPFLEFIKKDIQKQKRDINLQYFIATFTYLSLHNSFPYQYFYKVKEDLMDFIESAQNLSEKKVSVSLYMLQIFSRRELAYCERIIGRLIRCIESNLIASDISQITRIFYHYSRLKYSPDNQFILKLVERITLFMDVLDEKHYALIIRAITNLNYQNTHFLQTLKHYNYELLLAQLKYGCEQLGEYYKGMIQEVQDKLAERNKEDLIENVGYKQNGPQRLNGQ